MKEDKIHIIVFSALGYLMLTNRMFPDNIQIQMMVVYIILVLFVLESMGYWDLFKKNLFMRKNQFIYLLLPVILELAVVGIGATVVMDTLFSSSKISVLESIKGVVEHLLGGSIYTTLMAVREEIGTTFLWGVAAMLLIKVIRKADGWSKKDFLWAGLIVNVFFAWLHVRNALNIYQIVLDNHGVIVAIIGWVTMILFAFVFGMYTEMVFFKTHNLFVTMICHTVSNLSRGVSIFGRLELFDVKSLVVFNLVTCVYGLVTFWIYKSNWKDTFWEKELGLKGQTEPL